MNASNSAVSFYEARLVCHAAPSIGCGNKAKFMLVDLEKYTDAVDGAWLNKKGTVVAVKWNENTDENEKAEVIQTVSTNHSIELTTLSSIEADSYANHFPITGNGLKAGNLIN